MTWIKCNERMPGEDGRYLVVECYAYYWVGICSLRDGKWDSPTVKYWMSLPELPEYLK